MWRYVIKRILALIPVIIAISLLVFILIDLAPGNAIDVIAADYSDEAYEELVHRLGYDRSVFYRYYLYVKGIFQGSFGTSIIYNQDVFVLYSQRFPTTIRLAIVSFLFALALSLPLGIFSAVRRGSVSDNAAMVLAVLGLSIPNFWLGLMLIVLFSLKLKWLPSGGDTHGILGLILPMITIGTEQMAYITRTTRMSMVEVLGSEYLLTARAKGVPERTI
ncbi:MAG: ABC transporter permease, partial [Clostridia bacterium]|nr:ABC transporter permease [Clostridia bacterium]